MPRRTGVFGGTFNPVHTGHLILAQDALEHFALDRVLWVPAHTPPHKRSAALADAGHRHAMLERAVQDNPAFEVWNDELERGGVSYTVDTLRRLRERFPGDALFLLIGADTLVELHSWKDIGVILDLCEVVSVARPGHDLAGLTSGAIGLPAAQSERLLKNLLIGHVCDISSTEIRHRASTGRSIRYLVPRGVEDYIRAHRLYASQENSP